MGWPGQSKCQIFLRTEQAKTSLKDATEPEVTFNADQLSCITVENMTEKELSVAVHCFASGSEVPAVVSAGLKKLKGSPVGPHPC